MKRRRVVIVGGGFAGLACARALDPGRYAVTLVDRRRSFEFTPNIHELVSGRKRAQDLRLPLGDLLRNAGHRYRCAEVVGVDRNNGTVQLARGGPLAFDYLALAPGSVNGDFGVAGVAAHAMPLKSTVDGTALHRRLRSLRREGGKQRVVVVGSGLAGTEILGELLRRWRSPTLELSIVEAARRLLPAGPASVSRHLQRHCEAQGVAVHTGSAVARLTPRTVWLRDGRRLRSNLTIWAAGPAPPPLLADAAIAGAGAWGRVGADLRLAADERIFIAGDAAAPPAAPSRQAYHALDMGALMAANIDRASRGRRTRRYRPLGRPTLLAFGDIDTLLIAGRLAVAGPALSAAKEGVYLAVMAQLDSRRLPQRVAGLRRRARAADVTWPTLRSWDTLRRQTRLQTLVG
jgi:NADH dehydrogenase FAD-containing subunit